MSHSPLRVVIASAILILLSALNGAMASEPAQLTAAMRRESIEAIAAAAEQLYVDPKAGARLAAHLRAELGSGAYEKLSDPREFADRITTSMRSAVNDIHLRLVYEPERSGGGGEMQRVVLSPGAQAPQGGGVMRLAGRIDPRSRDQIARTNYGFERVERLAGNVGYLRMTRFVPLDYSASTASAAMAFLENSDAIIVDLRGVPGGSPELVTQLVSYFTGSERVRLMATYNRATDSNEEAWSLAEVPGRKLSGKPLYVLQDADSASAAEMFSYFVQRHRLGRVVGATSAGAGNGGNKIAVGNALSFFVPQRRIIDGPGWEQTGVVPDVRVSSGEALTTAHVAALRELAAKAGSDAARRDYEAALRTLERTTPAPREKI